MGSKFLLLVLFSSAFATGFCQHNLNGQIFYEKETAPASFATILLLHHPGGRISDKEGKFQISLTQELINDTLQISSVGYRNLLVPVKTALKSDKFTLTQIAADLDNVVVKSFTSEQVLGTVQEATGYFRAWNVDSTGGELGQIFTINHAEYRLNKVKFKVNNGCKVCGVRIHIRKVEQGTPTYEILKDSVSIVLANMTMEDKIPEFDLNKFNIILKEKSIYVGLEVLYCESTPQKVCSFSFVGTEPGSFIYKTKRTSDWESSTIFSTYLKLYLGY